MTGEYHRSDAVGTPMRAAERQAGRQGVRDPVRPSTPCRHRHQHRRSTRWAHPAQPAANCSGGRREPGAADAGARQLEISVPALPWAVEPDPLTVVGYRQSDVVQLRSAEVGPGLVHPSQFGPQPARACLPDPAGAGIGRLDFRSRLDDSGRISRIPRRSSSTRSISAREPSSSLK